ncbi:hypothetical protein RJ641_025745, partial [Dillenia turbinata]
AFMEIQGLMIELTAKLNRLESSPIAKSGLSKVPIPLLEKEAFMEIQGLMIELTAKLKQLESSPIAKSGLSKVPIPLLEKEGISYGSWQVEVPSRCKTKYVTKKVKKSELISPWRNCDSCLVIQTHTNLLVCFRAEKLKDSKASLASLQAQQSDEGIPTPYLASVDAVSCWALDDVRIQEKPFDKRKIAYQGLEKEQWPCRLSRPVSIMGLNGGVEADGPSQR